MAKKLDKGWTDEQRKEAKKFGKIMSQCFESSGQNCRCEEIPFAAFAEACSEAAPLAIACDIQGNEDACDKLDSLEMPELPNHLQQVFDDLEGGMDESRYDMHMPKECVKAGVTNPKECGKVMIKINAPEECKQALLDSGCEQESECREICDGIMMQKHAPECVEQGITDSDECQEYMFSIDKRPEECQRNQIHDLRDCKRFLENGGNMGQRRGPGINIDCGEIEDSSKRLACYDGAIGGFRDFDNRFEETREQERQCADECSSQNAAWDFSGGECSCKFYEGDFEGGDFEQGYFDDQGNSYEESECKDGCSQECPGASRTDCVNGGTQCECYYDGAEFDDNSYDDYSNDFSDGGDGEFYDDGQDYVNSGDDFGGGPDFNEAPPETFNEPAQEPAQEPASEPSSNDGSGMTGGVISDFWNYFW